MSEGTDRKRRRLAAAVLAALLLFLLGTVAGDWLAGATGGPGGRCAPPGAADATQSSPTAGESRQGTDRRVASERFTHGPREFLARPHRPGQRLAGERSPGGSGAGTHARGSGQSLALPRSDEPDRDRTPPEGPAAPLRGGLATRTPPAVPRGEGDEDCGSGASGAPGWPGEVLFRPAGSFDEGALAGLAEFLGSELQPRISGCLLARGLPAGVSEREWAAFLRSEGLAQAAYPNFLCWPAWVPNDPQLPVQWNVDKIGLKSAWDVTQGDASLVIAVCDTGIDTDHPDLAGKIVAGYNSADDSTNVEDVNGHGTSVSGMAAAITDNALQIAGTAPTCQIMPVKISNASDGVATLADMTDGIAWAHANGAHVVNCSYNGPPDTSFYDAMDDAGALCDVDGAVLVMAAGNNTADMGTDKPWDHVLWIGSTNSADALSSFSQYGDAMDLVAPGENVWVSAMGGSTATKNGTSFASPCVAGVLGLMYAASSFALAPAEYRAALYSTCADLGDPGKDIYFGWGRVDAYAAVIEVGTPTALVSANPTSGPTPLTVVFAGSSNMDGRKTLTYYWDFGDGDVGMGKTAAHTYTAVGSYTATLTVVDSGGLSGTDTVTITVGFGGMPEVMYLWCGQRVDYTFMPIGGGSSASVTLVAGTLPPGLDLTDGRMTGIPTTCGTWNVTLRVDDGVSPPGDHDLTILVKRPGFARFRSDPWR